MIGVSNATWIPADVADIVEATIAIYRHHGQTRHLCAGVLDSGDTLRFRVAGDTTQMVDVSAPARSGRKATITGLDGTPAKLPAGVRATLDDVWALYTSRCGDGTLEPAQVGAAIGAATHTLRNRDAGIPISVDKPHASAS